ncbi:MAG: FAD:protein FMN transferase [Desulfamplus sp.]|nr:FAD:protein FMN transferase [Desulfamplus sp.]
MVKNISIQIKFFLILSFLSTVFSSKTYADDPKIQIFTGNTMGTTYNIKVVMPNSQNGKDDLSSLIENRLKQINQSMSVYIKSSEISIFNSLDKGKPLKISPEFYSVMVIGQNLYKITNRAWDGTVKPLVDLWGFGTKGVKSTFVAPSSEVIKAYLQTTGFNQIIIGDERQKTVKKKSSAVILDLGSIAKGFGVDAVAQLLKAQGYLNFLVEIGGEVFASGEKRAGNLWVVGVSKPKKGVGGSESSNEIYLSLPLKDMAIATSGDYRNFTTIEGKTYSHVINPVTGYPVDNGVVSVSVIADNCTFADGLATALMVMGHKKGIELVNSLENVEALIVVREQMGGSGKSSGQYSNAQFIDYRSTKFPLP